MNIIKCLAHTKWGGRPRKTSYYTQNDITKHLKIRRRGLSSAKKAQSNPQPNKIDTASVCSLPHREHSMQSRSIHTRPHEKPDYPTHSHQQQPQSLNMTILLKPNQNR
jgi:hypothetical protein